MENKDRNSIIITDPNAIRAYADHVRAVLKEQTAERERRDREEREEMEND